MSKLIAGIDPGEKTGLAIWDCSEQQFKAINTVGIIAAQEILRVFYKNYDLQKIYFEDARQGGGKADSKRLQGVGSVKRDSAIWQEFCEYYHIPHAALKPDKNLTKWPEEYFKKITGWTGRTSQHARDAAVLVFAMK